MIRNLVTFLLDAIFTIYLVGYLEFFAEHSIVSDNLRSSTVSKALVNRIVSVIEMLFVPSVVFVGEMQKNVAQYLVGVVVFDNFSRGIFGEDMIEFNLV